MNRQGSDQDIARQLVFCANQMPEKSVHGIVGIRSYFLYIIVHHNTLRTFFYILAVSFATVHVFLLVLFKYLTPQFLSIVRL